MAGWGGRRSRIVVVGLEEFHDVIYSFIRIGQKICVRCSNFEEIIGSNVLDILNDFLLFEVHCFWCIGHTSGDKGKGHTDIVGGSF